MRRLPWDFGTSVTRAGGQRLRRQGAFRAAIEILKVLWLMQQTTRVPCTESNLARLLADDTNADVLDLEMRLHGDPGAARTYNYVRQDAGSGQWRFLTPDEVTVEKIVPRIAGDLPAKEVRDEPRPLFAERLRRSDLSRRQVRNNLRLRGAAQRGAASRTTSRPSSSRCSSPRCPLRADPRGTCGVRRGLCRLLDHPCPRSARRATSSHSSDRRLRSDAKFNEIRTSKTDVEADKLIEEANQIRSQATEDLRRALGQGDAVLGRRVSDSQRGREQGRLSSRRAGHRRGSQGSHRSSYPRFAEGDRKFDERNIERLLDTPASKRARLDPDLGLFDADGHVHADNVLAAALVTFVNGVHQDDWGGPAGVLWGSAIWLACSPPEICRHRALRGRASRPGRQERRAARQPRSPSARTVVGSRDFGSTRVVVEENPLTPDEATAIREVLSDLGETTKDNSGAIPS